MKSATNKNSASGRNKGLSPPALVLVRDATRCIDRADFRTALSVVTLASAHAPGHPEPLRLMGITQARLGHYAEAVKSFAAVLAVHPDDRETLLAIAHNQVLSNDVAAAVRSLIRLAALETDPEKLFRVAMLLDAHGAIDEAMHAAARVLDANAGHATARILLARTQVAVGQLEQATAHYRQLIANDTEVAKSWYGLAEIKTLKLRPDELDALEAYCERSIGAQPAHDVGHESAEDRVSLLYALGKAMEDAGRHTEAFTAFSQMGRLMLALNPWDGDAFSSRMSDIRKAFPTPVDVREGGLGREVIFIVGLPRSGSTLTEQILAAHPLVEGASELPDLNAVIEEESVRRRVRFPLWVKNATPSDWARMGQTYMERTERWRRYTPHFTDKLPENWELIEAALAMLPGTRIIECRRDPIETCWSCFKQLFAPGRVCWSYTFPDLARYWEESRRHARHLVERYPDRVRTQSYEALLADTEAETRSLLAFCGLPFDQRSLQFYDASRAVRTASAAQVREPIRQGTGRTAGYGALLDVLRSELDASQQRLGLP